MYINYAAEIEFSNVKKFHVRRKTNFEFKSAVNEYEIIIEIRNPCPFKKLLGKENNYFVRSPLNLNILSQSNYANDHFKDKDFIENYWNVN